MRRKTDLNKEFKAKTSNIAKEAREKGIIPSWPDPPKKDKIDHLKELRETLRAFDDYIWHGSSHRNRLDGLLQIHGFDLSKPIGALDIVDGFCKRYKLDISYKMGDWFLWEADNGK